MGFRYVQVLFKKKCKFLCSYSFFFSLKIKPCNLANLSCDILCVLCVYVYVMCVCVCMYVCEYVYYIYIYACVCVCVCVCV